MGMLGEMRFSVPEYPVWSIWMAYVFMTSLRGGPPCRRKAVGEARRLHQVMQHERLSARLFYTRRQYGLRPTAYDCCTRVKSATVFVHFDGASTPFEFL